MSKSTDVLASLMHLLADEEALAHIVLHIRVSESAIPGSMVAVPAFPDGPPDVLFRIFGRFRGDPERLAAKIASYKEIIVHPDDWAEIRALVEAMMDSLDQEAPGPLLYLMGVYVIE